MPIYLNATAKCDRCNATANIRLRVEENRTIPSLIIDNPNRSLEDSGWSFSLPRPSSWAFENECFCPIHNGYYQNQLKEKKEENRKLKKKFK